MTVQEFILKLSQEGRAWAALVLPLLAAWHCPPPAWGKKGTPDGRDNPGST